jgi:hypothetical protein
MPIHCHNQEAKQAAGQEQRVGALHNMFADGTCNGPKAQCRHDRTLAPCQDQDETKPSLAQGLWQQLVGAKVW